MKQRGLSLVEMMVGITIGMLVLAAATQLYVNYLRATQRTLLNARISQDLRSAAAMMARELRRTGYWPAAASYSAADRNPYGKLVAGNSTLEYSYGHGGEPANAAVPLAGFRLQNGVLQLRTVGEAGSSGWQPLTDPAVLKVTTFSTEQHQHEVEIHRYCQCLVEHRCSEPALAADPKRPRLLVQRIDTVLRAQATQDASIEREVRDTVSVRNERIEGQCP